MRNQISLMDLRTPRDESKDHRGPDAASDIAHEIQEAGDRVALRRRHPGIRDQGDGHEQKSYACYLREPQKAGRAKADLQVQLLRGEIHGYRSEQPAKSDDVAGLKL